MRAIEGIRNHIQGLHITLNTFIQGRFLWFLIPGILLTITYFGFLYYYRLEQYTIETSSGISFIDTIIGWFNTVASWLHALFTYILEKIYVFIVLTVLSPFHAYIAERFDHSMTGKKFAYSFTHFLQDFFRMLAVVTLALIMELGFMLVWWVLSFIPGLSLLDDVMYFLISAFFFGFAFHDYALERYRLSIGKSIQFAFNRPITMVLTGALFLGMYAIPYVGIPFSGVLTTMVATVVYLRIHEQITVERTTINPKD